MIPPLGPDDAAAFQALRLCGLRESPEAFGGSYEEEVDRPLETVAERLGTAGDDVVLGAWGDDGALLGVAGLHRAGNRKGRHRAGVWGMYVAPEGRGRGIGRALPEGLVAHARVADGIDRLELGVATTHEAARALYLRFGFTPCGIQPDAYRSGGVSWDSELMTLKVNKAPA